MTKLEFIFALRDSLKAISQSEVEEHLNFYSEMIEDRVEEGLSEQEAVAEIGSVEEIAAQILADFSNSKPINKPTKPKRKFKTWEIVLLAIGSPIWLSLAIAAFAVAISLYASLWAVIISLWSVFASLVGCCIGGILACVIFAVGGSGASGVAMLAAGIVCAGLAIFMFCGCKTATKGTLILTRKMAIWIKNCFIKKETV